MEGWVILLLRVVPQTASRSMTFVNDVTDRNGL